MKMQADRPEGSNAITRHGPQGVVVNGQEHRQSLLVPWRGDIVPWAVDSFEALEEASFEALAALDPEAPVESVRVLTNKVNRGRFTFAFFLRAIAAMGVQMKLDAPAALHERDR